MESQPKDHICCHDTVEQSHHQTKDVSYSMQVKITVVILSVRLLDAVRWGEKRQQWIANRIRSPSQHSSLCG